MQKKGFKLLTCLQCRAPSEGRQGYGVKPRQVGQWGKSLTTWLAGAQVGHGDGLVTAAIMHALLLCIPCPSAPLFAAR